MALSPILLASVLKPLDDTRLFGKFGRTLAERPELHVHVAGRAAPAPTYAPPNLHTHTLLRGGRLSLARLAAQGRYWRLLHRLRPKLVFVHAPELLPLTLLWRAMGRGRHFVYDVRENYALNIQTQQVYPGVVRQLLAGLVRWVETAAARRAAAVVLAERSYAAELPFGADERTIILENKYQQLPGEAPPTAVRPLPAPGQPLRLLYSGTISRLNGVFDAVAFARQLRAQWPGTQLTIIGFCQQPAVLAELRALLADDADVTLIGGAELVPHAQIVAEIRRSHVGLLPYRSHPSTWRCLPTKLFEYAAHGLPLLLPANPLWQAALGDTTAALVCPDFARPDVPALVAALRRTAFYPHGIPAGVLWQAEAAKLWQIVDSIG